MKSSKRSLQMTVGIFVAAGLVLFVFIVFMLGGGKKIFETDYNLLTQFNDISGLREGAPVQLAGVQVGMVSEIRFSESLSNKKVTVTLSVQSKYQKRVRENSVATISTQGLLGDKMIQITVGNPDTEILKDGDILKTSEPANFNEMLGTANELLENVNRVASNVNGILEEVRSGDGLMHEVIYGYQGKELIYDLNDAADHLKIAGVQFQEITTKINQGQGTIGALVNDGSVFNDVKTLLGKANRNKLIKAVIRYTLQTRDEKLHQKE